MCMRNSSEFGWMGVGIKALEFWFSIVFEGFRNKVANSPNMALKKKCLTDAELILCSLPKSKLIADL